MTRFKAMEETAEPALLEPQGHNPFLVFVDTSMDDDSVASASDPIVDQYGNVVQNPLTNAKEWRPDLELLSDQKDDCVRTY